jgi:hypothetical protein
MKEPTTKIDDVTLSEIGLQSPHVWESSKLQRPEHYCTFRITPREGVTVEALLEALCDDILPTVTVPSATRGGGITDQELLLYEGNPYEGTAGASILWRLHFNGLNLPDLARAMAKGMGFEVQDRLDAIGQVQELRVMTPKRAWHAIR